MRPATAPDGFGAATSIETIQSDATYSATLAREFDYVTPENDMKWELVEPGRNRWNWAPADGLVTWASAHGMRIKGHNLVLAPAAAVVDVVDDRLAAGEAGAHRSHHDGGYALEGDGS